jgi:serine phosphatase RsbU (regulator of sigma subunit)
MSIYYENGSFKLEKVFQDIKYSVRFMVQDKNHNLWCGINGGGLLFIKAPSDTASLLSENLETIFYGEESGLPSGSIFPIFYNNQLILATGEGVFEYNQKLDTFYHAEYLGDWYSSGKHAVHRLDIDNLGNIWSITFSEDGSLTFVTKSTRLIDDDEPFITQKLLVDEKELLHAIYTEKNGVVWVAGTNGVYKLNWKGENDVKLPFKTYINNIIAGPDTIFSGVFYDENNVVVNSQLENLYPIIDYKNNNISFDFSAIGFNYEANLNYSWKLENFEDEWTNWENKSEERYTNLHEGKYTFHVRAKDVFGNVSDVASYSFTIKPPWYRTILAYILYVLFFIVFVWAAITISTNSLRKIIKEATAKIQKQKDDIEEKNKNIMDSIRYAQRIQEAVLPSDAKIRKYFPEHFVLFKPRDIVSGDFYWMMNKGEKTILVAADCTGHGVPGAFMSIMGVSFLNEIANKKEVQTAAEVLNQLRANIINSLNTDEGENKAKDGMDISVCVYDFNQMSMQFAGAYNHLYFVRDGKFDKIKADRMPVGVHERDDNAFTNNVFDIKKGDIYYILSDGLIDQFGGPDGKKFMTKRFKDLIMDIYDKPMAEQKAIIDQEHLKWRGETEQLDDIILIGVKVV